MLNIIIGTDEYFKLEDKIGKEYPIIAEYGDYCGSYVDVVNVEYLEQKKFYYDGLCRYDGHYGCVDIREW